MPKSRRKKRVMKAPERVGTAHRVRHYPSQLSGGQQTRGRGPRPGVANHRSPPMSPTGNLDSRNGDAVMELLVQRDREGVRICMVTHDALCQARRTRSALRPLQSCGGRIEKADGGCVCTTGSSSTFRTLGADPQSLPAFTAVAVLTPALGIGANTAIFSLVNTLMLRIPPVREPGQLVECTDIRVSRIEWLLPASLPGSTDPNTVFDGLTAASYQPFHVRGEGLEPHGARPGYVDGNFFPVLGVKPAIAG